MYMYMLMSMSLSMSMFRDLESGLSKDLKNGERGLRRTNAGGASVTILTFRLFVMPMRKGRKTNRTIQLFVSLGTAEDEQLHQVKRMIKRIGHVLFSSHSRTRSL